MTETVKHNVGPVGFTIVAELGASRQINIGGNFPENASKESIDATLDLILNAINRQQSKAGIINKTAEIAAMERNLRMQREDIERLDGKAASSGKTLSVNERQHREAAIINARRLEDDIKLQKEVLAEFQRDAK